MNKIKGTGCHILYGKIPAERHSISINELTTDEKRELIKAMNHFRAVVSLFPRRLTMPN